RHLPNIRCDLLAQRQSFGLNKGASQPISGDIRSLTMQTVRQDIHNSEVPVLCQSCEARHQGICGALNSEQLMALAKSSRRVRREAGEELMADAMPIANYSNVLRGVVKLSKVLE